MKEELMEKLKQRDERQYKTLKDLKKSSNQCNKKDEDEKDKESKNEGTVHDNSMLAGNVLEMDKMDLLLHVQKLQLIIDEDKEERLKADTKTDEIDFKRAPSQDLSAHSSLINDLQHENAKLKKDNHDISILLQRTERESNEHLLRLKRADIKIEELQHKVTNGMEEDDTIEEMRSEVNRINSELNIQTEKRKRMEMLFQDVSEREMKIQQFLEESEQKVKQLGEENLELRMNNENEKKGCEILKGINEQLQQELNELSLRMKAKSAENGSQIIIQKGVVQSCVRREATNDRDDIVQNTQEEMLNLVRESEAALESKVKELEYLKDKITKTDEANHKLIVESQVLKREILDIKESTTKDKHVSISLTERHKREREQLLKEIESQNREIRRMREEQKKKEQHKEAEAEKLEHDILTLSEALDKSKASGDAIRLKLQRSLDEEKNKNLHLVKKANEIEKSVKRGEESTDNFKLEIVSLIKKNDHLRAENQQLVKKSKEVLQGRCHRGTSTDSGLGNMLEKTNSPLPNDECTNAMEDLANELVLVKNELTTLKTVLEEKDKELTRAKSMSSSIMFQNQKTKESNKTANDPELQKLADDLKFQLYSKENQLLEVDLKLQFSERKIGTYDSHVKHLRERVANLETQLEETTEVTIIEL